MYKKRTSNIHNLLTVFVSFWCDQIGVLMNSNFFLFPMFDVLLLTKAMLSTVRIFQSFFVGNTDLPLL